MNDLPLHWQKFLTISANYSSAEQTILEDRASSWVETYRANGYLSILPSQILSVPDYQFACFYQQFVSSSLENGCVASPVAGQHDSNWMIKQDFCFLNIRAVAPEPSHTGTFIDAIKVLLFLRVSAIHLAPFFESVFENVYAVNSLNVIAPELVDQEYASQGLDAEEQLMLLVDAIHSLGMVVGFDLEPHTAQFSRVVLMFPEQFRWLELSPDRTTLAGGISLSEMVGVSVQKKIIAKVRQIVEKQLGAAGLATLEQDSVVARETYATLVQILIDKGLWTIPSHSWGGVGLPNFIGYDKKGNYPVFEYLDGDGNDHSKHAFGMLTPFKFCTGLSPNQAPDATAPSCYWDEGIQFFAGLFPAIQQKYKFDFLRVDYVDHIFDSVVNEGDAFPVSDRATPEVLRAVLGKARERAPYLGAMAERMGYDFDSYKDIGFDLVLGAEMLRLPTKNFVMDQLRFYCMVEKYNASHTQFASIQHAVDSHDTGHPEIDADPVRLGIRGMLLRLFLARFTCAGKGRRPKYEVIGNQDMTTGLYDANNSAHSLSWADNDEFFSIYQNIENIYCKFRDAIENSYIRECHFEEEYVVWYLDRLDGFKMRLGCVCAPFAAQEQKSLEAVRIYPFLEYGFDCARVEEIDIIKNRSAYMPIDPDGYISFGSMEPGEVRLFWIRENGMELP